MGRPLGSKNVRSGDLHKWVAAEFGGLTPGQQSAKVGLVTPAEVKAAGGVLEAMAIKAKRLAITLDVPAAEAWRMMAKERADLMPFVHQRLAQLELAPLGKGAGLAGPTLIVADLDDQVHGLGPLFGEDEDNQDLIEGEAREVARPELHAPAEPEPDQ